MELINSSTEMIDLRDKNFKYPHSRVHTFDFEVMSGKMARQAGNSNTFYNLYNKIINIEGRFRKIFDFSRKGLLSFLGLIDSGLDFDYNSIMSNSRRAEASMRPTVT